MDKSEIQTLAEMERTYWWHTGKREIVRSLLGMYFRKRGAKILDYGCGTGENGLVLREFGDFHGTDSSPEAVEICRQKNLHGVQLVSDGEVPTGRFALITAFDVIEHVRDDIGLLTRFHAALEPDGLLLITVPAYRFLWSEHDEALRHVRRYVASELRAKLTLTGFDVVRTTYSVMFIFIPILVYRLFRGIFPKDYAKPKTSYVLLPKPVNRLLHQLLVLESRMIRWISLPFGCSLIAVARKRP